jgi:hypothetical protein
MAAKNRSVTPQAMERDRAAIEMARSIPGALKSAAGRQSACIGYFSAFVGQMNCSTNSARRGIRGENWLEWFSLL